MRPFYYVRTQEKVEIALLDMFNNIVVNKYNDLSRTDFSKTLRVRIITHYEKNFANWYRNNDFKRRPPPLPVGGLRYLGKTPNDSNRTQATYCRNIFSRATDRWMQDIQPTPYILNYELSFLMDNKSDFGQITENIVPYFNTSRSLRIKEWDFAPDIERKCQVYLTPISDEFDDEMDNDAAKHRLITTKFNLRVEVDWYRPFEIPEVIKYAELNLKVDDFLHKTQVLVYPDEIAEAEKKAWEKLTPSTRLGYSLLSTCAGTFIKKLQLDGSIEYEDISCPDSLRPTEVPSFKLLLLDFDDDSPIATDESGFGRDFEALDDSTRTYIPDFPPGSGQETETGYGVESSVVWNKILNWFGTDNGEHESPYTFSITLKFNEDNPDDTIFQYLSNVATTDESGNVIPADAVFFDWGLMDSKLYFSFQTYGSKALSYTFVSNVELELNSTDTYKFNFVLYEQGHSGIFGYAVNDEDMIALAATRY